MVLCAIISSISIAKAEDILGTGSSTQENPLILDAITTQDDMHVMVSFNENIVAEAVRVRITKQSDGSIVKTEKITAVTDIPRNVLISLTDTLQEGGTYTITILSAISEGGTVIKEWADAVKEFTVPIPLKKSLLTFNAPSNPSAVITNTGIQTTPAKEDTNSGKITTPEITVKELPLTGMNPIIFLVIASGLAFLLVSSRKKA